MPPIRPRFPRRDEACVSTRCLFTRWPVYRTMHSDHEGPDKGVSSASAERDDVTVKLGEINLGYRCPKQTLFSQSTSRPMSGAAVPSVPPPEPGRRTSHCNRHGFFATREAQVTRQTKARLPMTVDAADRDDGTTGARSGSASITGMACPKTVGPGGTKPVVFTAGLARTFIGVRKEALGPAATRQKKKPSPRRHFERGDNLFNCANGLRAKDIRGGWSKT